MPRLTPVLRSALAGVSFTIRTDTPSFVAGLCQRWKALPPGSRRPDLLFDACFRPHQPRLWLNGRARCVARDANHLLAELELAIYAELAARSSATPIHAAAVVIDDRAVLLAGASGAGKSTLAWGLIQRGADYLGEEHVFLDQSGALSGLPRALSFEGPTGLGLAWPPRVRLSAQTLGLVVLLERPRRAEGLRELGVAEAAAALTQHLHRPPRDADLAQVVGALRGVPAIALAQEGVESALTNIEATLGANYPALG